MTWRQLLIEYLLNKEAYLENLQTNSRNLMILRGFDEVDCLEDIILASRIKAFNEFSRDLKNLMAIGNVK